MRGIWIRIELALLLLPMPLIWVGMGIGGAAAILGGALSQRRERQKRALRRL